MEDTPSLGEEFCPVCNPQDVFERRDDGKVWVARAHERCLGSLAGNADGDLPPHIEGYLGGTGDAPAADQRAIQGLIRRQERSE